jgi:hypothetical protein
MVIHHLSLLRLAGCIASAGQLKFKPVITSGSCQYPRYSYVEASLPYLSPYACLRPRHEKQANPKICVPSPPPYADSLLHTPKHKPVRPAAASRWCSAHRSPRRGCSAASFAMGTGPPLYTPSCASPGSSQPSPSWLPRSRSPRPPPPPPALRRLLPREDCQMLKEI